MILWFLACTGAAPEPDVAAPAEVQTVASLGEKRTQSGKYVVTLRAEPDPPPLGELFAMHATVTHPDGTPVEKAKVLLDARMPQHQHGMETQPKPDPGTCTTPDDCTHPGGQYHSKGFKLHMPGAWTFTVDVDGPVGRDTTSFVYELR